MDIVVIILGVIIIIGLILLLIGSMTDKGWAMTIGLICALLGALILFTYKFLSFVSHFN